MKVESRTDLAVELQEELQESEQVGIKGIRVEKKEKKDVGIVETIITIETKEASEQMGKPIGSYITLESECFLGEDHSYYEELSQSLHERLKQFISREDKVLVVGLGNKEVTPDALGPLVVEHLFITRHLKKYHIMEMEQEIELSGIIPGVMAQTGMETQEIIKGVIEQTKPNKVLAIDALAARSSNRLNKTIQISNTGIAPGSGVGNHRKALTEETLGVPVIAIGVPTVISVPSIVNESMQTMFQILEQTSGENLLETFTEEEQYELAREIVAPDLSDMFVTPKNIDEAVKRISFTISEAINQYITVSSYGME